jgi:predicted TIM-barrel fold metal-dependent hydrolase
MKREKQSWYGRVIDHHTHIFDGLPDPDEKELEKMVSLARRYGIGRVVMLANANGILLDIKGNTSLIRDTNSYTLAAMSSHPGFFVGFCYLNPLHPIAFIEEELERCIVKGGMKGIKLEAALNARDRRMDPLLERIQDLGVPLLHHTWYKTVNLGINESTPADLLDLAKRFPKVTIIMAHLGGIRQRGVLDMLQAPNLYVDTSGAQPEDGLIEYAVNRIGAERIFFGSDWPIRDFGVQIGRIDGSDISDDEKNLILFENASRMLHLDGEADR